MTKAEIPFYFLPRLLGLGYMFFDLEVRNTKSWKGKLSEWSVEQSVRICEKFPARQVGVEAR